MTDIPKCAGKFYLRDFVEKRRGDFGGRIIDPSTGHQEEVFAEQVEFTCPNCRLIQLAPPDQNVEYACPRCDTRYLVDGEMLAVWDPKRVGVTTHAEKPGTRVEDRGTPHGAILDTGSDPMDPEKVKHAYLESIKKFLKKSVNSPDGTGSDFAKKTQVGSTGKGNGKSTE